MSSVDTKPHVSALFPQVEQLVHPKSQPVDISLHGTSQVRDIVITADSSSSTSCSFSYNLTASNLLERTVYLRYSVEALVTSGTNNQDVDLATANRLIPSQFPLHRCMKSLNVTLNNLQKSEEPHAYNNALLKYEGADEMQEYFSQTATQPDLYNRLARMPTTDAPRSPFVGDGYNSRADFPRTVVETQASASSPAAKQIVKMTWTFCEPLQHSFFSNDDNDALANVSHLGVDIVWNNEEGALLEHSSKVQDKNSPAANCTVSGVAFTSAAPELLIRTHTPSVSVPDVVTVPFTDKIVKRFTISGTLSALDTTTLNTSNVTLSQVPDRIFIFARQRDDVTTIAEPDGWLAITSLTMRTDNDAGGFSGSQQQDLYEISKKNGSEQTFQDFSDGQGSVLCLDLKAGDVGGYIAGTRTQFSHDFTIGFENTFADQNSRAIITRTGASSVNYECYVIYEMDGRMSLDGQNGMISSGSDVNSVLAAMSGGSLHMGGLALGGGKFLKKVRRFARKVGNIVKKVGLPALALADAAGIDEMFGKKGKVLSGALQGALGAGKLGGSHPMNRGISNPRQLAR